MLNYVQLWRPSWISDRHEKHKLGTGPSKDHSCKQFKWLIGYREDFSNFSQSERIIGHGGHVLIPIDTKNANFIEDHPRNIPAKFGSIWPSSFRGEDLNVES